MMLNSPKIQDEVPTQRLWLWHPVPSTPHPEEKEQYLKLGSNSLVVILPSPSCCAAPEDTSTNVSVAEPVLLVSCVISPFRILHIV